MKITLKKNTNLKQGAHIHQPTARTVRKRNAYNHTKRVGAAMDSCFSLIGALQHGITLGSMNGENPYLKGPLLLRQMQCTPLSAGSTQHMWELLVWNCTAVLPRLVPSLSFENSELNCSTA